MKKELTNNILASMAGVCLMLVSITGKAQQDSVAMRQNKLHEVIITATRTKKSPADVGRSVTVIDSAQLRNGIYNSVSELLSRQAGIFIVGTGQNPGANQSIYMRGANNNQTSVLIDGVRITDPSSVNDAIDISELSLSGIDHIEIVRGSHGTLYGSSAIGGVVNMFGRESEKPGFHTNINVEGGNFGSGTSLLHEDVFANYTFKNGFYVNGEVNKLDDKGLDATVDTVKHPLPYQMNRDKDNFNKQEVMGKIGYKTAKIDAYLADRSLDQLTDIDRGAFTDDNNYTLHFTRSFYTYGISYKPIKNLLVKYIGGYSQMDRKALDDTSIVDAYGDKVYSKNNYKGTSMTNELQLNYKLKHASFVLGGGQYHETMGQNTYTLYESAYGNSEYIDNLDSLKPAQTQNYVFAQADLNGALLSSKLHALDVLLGGRITNQNMFGNHLGYEINPSYKITKGTLLYGSYTTGFNAPSLYQLYAPKSEGAMITLGNKNLKAETSVSYELGIKQAIKDKLFFSVAWYNTQVKNSIDYVYLWNKNTPFDSLTYMDYMGDTYINVGTQTNSGFEFSLSSHLDKHFSFRANLSLMDGKLDYSPGNIDTTHTHDNYVQLFDGGAFITQKVETYDLLRRPHGMLNLSLSYRPCHSLLMSTRVRYEGSRTDAVYNSTLGPYGADGSVNIPAFTLVNFYVRYTFLKHFTLGCRVENLFNEKYTEIQGYTTRGRGFYGNLKFTF